MPFTSRSNRSQKVILININDFAVEMADFANMLEHVLKAHLTTTMILVVNRLKAHAAPAHPHAII